MRLLARCAAVLVCASMVSVSATGIDPDTWLAQARAAMGGAVAQEAVTSLTIRGSLNRSLAAISSNSSWEVSWQSPDKFLEVESRSMSMGPMGFKTTTRRNGFNGDRRIFQTISDLPVPDFPSPLPEATIVLRNKETLARLLVPLLGSAAALSGVYPLTVASVEAATSGETANVVVLAGQNGRQFRLFLDAATHLPAMVSWMGRPIVVFTTSTTVVVPSGGGRLLPGQPTPPALPAGDPTAGQPDVEYRMSFTDYRDNKGIRWPRRLTITIDGEKHEEIRVSRYTVNSKINPRTFAVAR